MAMQENPTPDQIDEIEIAKVCEIMKSAYSENIITQTGYNKLVSDIRKFHAVRCTYRRHRGDLVVPLEGYLLEEFGLRLKLDGNGFEFVKTFIESMRISKIDR